MHLSNNVTKLIALIVAALSIAMVLYVGLGNSAVEAESKIKKGASLESVIGSSCTVFVRPDLLGYSNSEKPLPVNATNMKGHQLAFYGTLYSVSDEGIFIGGGKSGERGDLNFIPHHSILSMTFIEK